MNSSPAANTTYLLVFWLALPLQIVGVNPLHPNISVYFLHTISFGAYKENFVNNQSFLSWLSFPLFSWP